ncbi:hypothetical protein HYV69_03240 [Candidatus Uhrbacteria bacterium]|nr:hypothetical protein [Candidatus Uhrbacteria bacterium]
MSELESVTTASHGDAQSDIVGGALITVMVLFLFMALLVIVFLVVLVQKQKQASEQTAKAEQLEQTLEQVLGGRLSDEEIKNLLDSQMLQAEVEESKQERDQAKEKQKQAEAEKQEAVVAMNHAMRQAADAEADAAMAMQKFKELQSKDKEAIAKFVSAGLRLWIFRDGHAVITDADLMPDGKHWQQKYVCKPKKAKLPAVDNNPDLESDHLIVQ